MLVQLLSSTLTWLLVAAASCAYLLRTKRRPVFPVVNDYPLDFFRRRAHREYRSNAKKLLADGFAKHGGPITVLVPGGSKIVLPSALSDWMKTNRDLDHQQLVREEYFDRFPGFEGLRAIHSADNVVIDMLRAKLSAQNESILPAVDRHVAAALEEHWGDGESWHAISWDRDTTGIISRAAASVFVGPEKAADPEWQALVQTYVRELFTAVGKLHAWPAPLRPLVQWFLPQTSACRALVRQARAAMRDVVDQRARETKAAADRGLEPPRYDDAVAWTQADPNNADSDKPEAGDIQLALAVAALFTTTEALKQVLIDIARHPELVEPLRQEIRQSLSDRWQVGQAALANMELLDSVVKESQRLVPLLVGLERKVMRDTTLPDGTRIPEGSHVMVDSSDMWSAEVHEEPESYDGYRFLKRRRAGHKATQFVQSSREHNVFGGGRHICPGRFFASSELKLCLAHILTKYDVRLKDGYRSAPIPSGFYAIVDPAAQLEVRRRGVSTGF